MEPLIDAVPSGSYVAASHVTSEFSRAATTEAGNVYTRSGVGIIGRDADVFADLVFNGLTLVPPGVVVVSEWRPEPGAILPPRADVSHQRSRRPQALATDLSRTGRPDPSPKVVDGPSTTLYGGRWPIDRLWPATRRSTRRPRTRSRPS